MPDELLKPLEHEDLSTVVMAELVILSSPPYALIHHDAPGVEYVALVLFASRAPTPIT